MGIKKSKKIRSVFIVEDDRFYANLLAVQLEEFTEADVEIFADIHSAKQNLYKDPDLILLDYYLQTDNGIDLLRIIKAIKPDIPVVFLSAQKNLLVAVNSLKYGAFDYLIKDETAFPKLGTVIERIVTIRELVARKQRGIRLRNGVLLSAAALSLAAFLFLLLN